MAQGPSPDGYSVLRFKVVDLRRHGIEVIADADLPDNPGHALLPVIRHENRKLAETKAKQALLTKLVDGIHHVKR